MGQRTSPRHLRGNERAPGFHTVIAGKPLADARSRPASRLAVIVREAVRCLKRRLSDLVYHQMILDARTRAAGPGGHLGAAIGSSAAGYMNQ